jgi:hypothetical protein
MVITLMIRGGGGDSSSSASHGSANDMSSLEVNVPEYVNTSALNGNDISLIYINSEVRTILGVSLSFLCFFFA